ncbi:MAG: FHA domain-containing protein [Chloroflexi bacterium]|nr:FHA domain-containing protein [Chloroflexota bacterium]
MDQSKNMQTRKLDDAALQHEAFVRNELAVDVGVPSKIALVVKHMQTKIVLQIVDPILIGRSFPEDSTPPFLDLQLFGADALGVSRNHLRLSSTNGEVSIEDLGSLNRTRLNGTLLEPHILERIRHGDQIALGGLVLKVEFIFDLLS